MKKTHSVLCVIRGEVQQNIRSSSVFSRNSQRINSRVNDRHNRVEVLNPTDYSLLADVSALF